MSYLVLARKYRPLNFEEILGQDAIVQTIKNAIERDRVAHAFLFSGPRGVGKTTLARVLAKALNCQEHEKATITPCGKCAACLDITNGSAVDVLEIDGASNTSVDNIRDLRETVRYMPASLRTKIYIIDEVHMLSISAFNALLKTLEEPPAHVKFMFATTDPHKVPSTILSRCQRYDFHRVSSKILVSHLTNICKSENMDIPENALRLIAREAEGGVRDSLSLLDQVASFGSEGLSENDILNILGVVDRTLISSICRATLDGDASAVLDALETSDQAGHDVKLVTREILHYFRNLVVIKVSKTPERLMDESEQEMTELKDIAAKHSLETLERQFDYIAKLDEDMSKTGQPRMVLELTLIKMATLPPLIPIADLMARLSELEYALSKGDFATVNSSGNSSGGAGRFTGGNIESPSRNTNNTGNAQSSAAPLMAGASADSWEDFLAFVKDKDGKIYHLLNSGRYTGREGNDWTLSFPTGNPIKERVSGDRNSKRIQKLLGDCFGNGHRLLIREDDSFVPENEVPNKYEEDNIRRKEALENPVVKAVLKELSGELDEVKLK